MATTSAGELQIPRPRAWNLSPRNYALFFQYMVWCRPPPEGEEIEQIPESKEMRRQIWTRMTEKQRRTFPNLANEWEIIYALVEAKALKEGLEEVAEELRLDADEKPNFERQAL